MRPHLLVFVIAATVIAPACGDEKQEVVVRPAPIAPTSGSAAVAAGSGSGAEEGLDPDAPEWVPAENKKGAGRWKDTGVYLDGVPVGFLTFGELPISLKPIWVKKKTSENKRPGSNDPGWRWTQQRHYRFDEYFTAIGLDLTKIKEVHVFGPRLSNSLVVSGDDLRGKEAEEFRFRFGSNVFGKAIPAAPYQFGNGNIPDKISAVTVYMDKTPPTLERTGFFLEGVKQTGIPYFGDPLRGGIRVYLDDKLAMIIKRQDLDPAGAKTAPDGELRWNFVNELKAKGVDTSKVVELWVISNELRKDKLPGANLSGIEFEASSQAKGGVTLHDGDVSLKAKAIALHTRALDPAEIPVILPDDR